ncbi:hypothetical protein HID58_084242 [Brassica napus]|uniref:Glyceraldehyde 3-phosphate dehydrogenase NAD(P) binding domain-containing protein n=1 Tax=Brassica napus TaxID=3708 RepID=A0ABQ7XJD8_BRANA|nr:hypothetical protein HID58_084242 [Brassica napus]
MASATFSVPKPSRQGFTEFSGLKSSSASLPFGKKLSSDEFCFPRHFPNFCSKFSAPSFHVLPYDACTHCYVCTPQMGSSGGYRKGVTEAKLKQASHLLKYDSTLGIFDADVKPSGDAALSVDGKIIQVVSNRNPSLLPWKELGIDIVIEGTGVFVDREGAGKHIEAGAKKGTMTTIHSYTGDQRRARAAALNIVPTSTGAAKAVALVLPNLKGKLNGIALRVPTPNVSVVDLVVQVSKKTFAEEVNAAFRDSAEKELKGILELCDEPLVSVDFRCSDVSSTIDSSLTMVMGDDMVKLIAWYDNEWGYSQRVVDLADIVANNWK